MFACHVTQPALFMQQTVAGVVIVKSSECDERVIDPSKVALTVRCDNQDIAIFGKPLGEFQRWPDRVSVPPGALESA